MVLLAAIVTFGTLKIPRGEQLHPTPHATFEAFEIGHGFPFTVVKGHYGVLCNNESSRNSSPAELQGVSQLPRNDCNFSSVNTLALFANFIFWLSIGFSVMRGFGYLKRKHSRLK